MSSFVRLPCLSLAVLLAACTATSTRTEAPDSVGESQASQPRNTGPAPEPDEADDVTTARSGVRFVEVVERFATAATPRDNIDSPTSWKHPDGSTWLIATAKDSHQLVVYDGDTGATLRTVGGPGGGPGQFRRPNGIAAHDDLLFVVERDNRRVQVLRLPAFQPLGAFGQDELTKPYGLWVRKRVDGYEVFVTDAYMADAEDEIVPPLAELDHRVQRYAVRAVADGLRGSALGAFGDTTAAGAIRITESIAGDEANRRLLLAEEDQADGTRLKVYGFDFTYTGQDLGRGLFKAQAEGLALWSCADGSGYWIATDQYKDRSVFHVFDRRSLAHLGAFAGRATANTDGVWLQQAATRAFPAGVFYAVDDDRRVSAFDWDAIAAALKLRASCAAP